MPAFGRNNWKLSGGTRAALCGVVACVVVGFLSGCSGDKATKTTPAAGKNEGTTRVSQPAQTDNGDVALKAKFRQAELSWSDERGRPVFHARFREAIASKSGDESVVELRDVNAALYSDGKIAGKLSAQRVVADSSKREVRASGGVKVISAVHNASADSEWLVWKSDEDRLLGKGDVRMVRDNISIAANSFEADTALRRAMLR